MRPARLPRLAFREGIPADHAVLVVIPCMLSSVDGVRSLVEQLERHHLANPEAHVQFALLSDWVDADGPRAPGDQRLLARARRAVDGLNATYSPNTAGSPLRFLLLHRERSWSRSEGRWIGWERKRGKLEQLVKHLVDPATMPFMDLGDLSRVRAGTRHVLTLDSDTVLPPSHLRELVGVAAHPLHLPRVDVERRRVVAGYGVLQPRVDTPLRPLPGARASTASSAANAGWIRMRPPAPRPIRTSSTKAPSPARA